MRTGYIAGAVVAISIIVASVLVQKAPENLSRTTVNITVGLKEVSTSSPLGSSADYLRIAVGTVQSWISDPALVKESVAPADFPESAASQSKYFSYVPVDFSAGFSVERLSTSAARNEAELASLVKNLQEKAAMPHGNDPMILINASKPTSGTESTSLPTNVLAGSGVGILMGVLIAALTERASAKKKA